MRDKRKASGPKKKRVKAGLERGIWESSLGFRFAAVLHEIRNPLTALSALIQLLPEKRNDKVFLRTFETLALAEIERLSSMTDSFLDLGHACGRGKTLVDVGLVGERAAQLLTPLFDSRKVRMKTKIGKGLMLQGSEWQIESLILNLAQNALHASKPGSQVELSITAVPGPSVELRVLDHGRGIAQRDIHRIFEPYFSTREKGMGLGLTICSRVVQNHEGTLEVDSSKSGTTFRALFPAIDSR